MKKNKPFRELFYRSLKKKLTIMRNALILLIVGVLQANAIDTYSQKTRLSLNFSDTELTKVLDNIEAESEFFFLYNEKLLNTDRKVNINEDDQPITVILDNLFANTNIKYTIIDRKIILAPDYLMPELQQKQITGIVTDKNGAPIAGANVVVTGTTQGTITDIAGKYRIDVPQGAKSLTFTFIGMEPQEVNIGGLTQVNATMTESAVGLNEVIVVGYGTQRKVDLTGSVASVSSVELNRGQPSYIEQALKGKIAGVQVRNSDGAPGGGIIVKIRGANSITAGNSPLYVIDGFPVPVSDDPYNNPLSKLSPESIESISILKDVSSTAIYGAQGANGVILITTKKAKEGVSEFSFKASVGINKLAKPLEMLSNEDYMKSMMLAAVMDQHWEYTDFYEDYKNQIWKTDPDRFQSYQDLCMRNGMQQKYDLTYSGGNSVVKNMTVVSLLNNQGVVITNAYKNINIMSNTSVKLLPKLSIDANLSYDYNSTDGIGYLNSIPTFSPLIPKEWGFKEIDDKLYYTGKMDNPYKTLTDTEQNRNKSQFAVQTELKWELFDGLTFKGGVGIRMMGENFKKYVSPTLLSSFNNEGEAQTSVTKGKNIRYAAQLFYAKTINTIHELSFGLIGEANSYLSESYFQAYTHFNTDLGWYGISSAKSGTFVTPPNLSYDKSNMLSGVIVGNYALKGRYLFKASFRADGSSRFGPENRWGYFPSGALGWRISDEEFFKSSFLSKFINNAKVRISAGSVGNDQIDNYIYINSLGVNSRRGVFFNASSPSSDGLYGSTSPTTILANYTNRMSNTAIAWETTSEINYGLDLGLFNSRINLTLDYYQKKTTNMLLNKALPMISGFGQVTRNIGSVGNKGIELGINANIIDKKDFSWDASFNISANRSKVLDLGGVDLMLQSRNVGLSSSSENVLIQVGKPLGLLYGLQMEGIRSTWASDNNAPYSMFWYNTQREGVYGFPSFADINGDGTVDKLDKTVIACVQPSYIGGFNQRFSYKFIQLSMDFSWSVGNDIINGNYYSLTPQTGISNKLKSYYGSVWFANNGGTIAGPGGGSWSGQGKNEASPSEIVEDGSFLRMNNLSLGINVPKSIIPVKSIKSIILSYSINNVFTLTRYSGYDPDVSSGSNLDNRILSGVDLVAYPLSKTHLITLNINF
jgi:TonB-linked SusC/RagA family outer membrane protein